MWNQFWTFNSVSVAHLGYLARPARTNKMLHGFFVDGLQWRWMNFRHLRYLKGQSLEAKRIPLCFPWIIMFMHYPLINCQKTYGKILHFSWENPLFLWSCSIAMLISHYMIMNKFWEPCEHFPSSQSENYEISTIEVWTPSAEHIPGSKKERSQLQPK